MIPNVFGTYDGSDARPRRRAAIEAALARFPKVQARFEAAYAMRLPRHLAFAAAFFLGLSSRERSLVPVSLFGFTEWFEWLAEGQEERIATLDERLEARFRADPPEFVTVASGNSDGSHWGFFYDLPNELPRFVAHGYARDDGAVWQQAPTLLASIRRELATDHLDPDDKQRMRAVVAWLDALHAEEKKAHAEEGIGAPFTDRVDSGSLGLGPHLPGFTLPEGIPRAEARWEVYAKDPSQLALWAARARDDARLALLLGRELHFADADETRALALELLIRGYEGLGRHPLAEIARVHHAHRDLKTVGIYRTRAQLDEPQTEYVTPQLVEAAEARDLDRMTQLLAESPKVEDIVAALYALRGDFDETRPFLEPLLVRGGAEAASQAIAWYWIGISSYVGPDVLEKASRPKAENARELVEMMLKKNDRRLVDLLLAHGARATSANDVGHAVNTGLVDLVEHALATAPAFDVAAHRTQHTLVEDFERPAEGATLLHLAVGAASPDIVRLLLARGLDPNVKDQAGQSPRDLAKMLWTVRPREANAMMEMFGTPEKKKPEPAKTGWEPGSKVRHAKFGEGTIVSVQGQGDEAKITVRFEIGEKTLLAKFLAR
ncbi:MAG: ADP-ribosylation family protein [Polyangiales bacterium]